MDVCVRISCIFSALSDSIAHTAGYVTCSLTDRYLDGFHTLPGGHLARNDHPHACVFGQMWGMNITGPEGCVSSHLSHRSLAVSDDCTDLRSHDQLTTGPVSPLMCHLLVLSPFQAFAGVMGLLLQSALIQLSSKFSVCPDLSFVCESPVHILSRFTIALQVRGWNRVSRVQKPRLQAVRSCTN